MTEGGDGGGGDCGGKTLGPHLPFPFLLSLFSPLFFSPEYEKLWMAPKGLGSGDTGTVAARYCCVALQ